MSEVLYYSPGVPMRLETYEYPTTQVGVIGVRLRSLADRTDTIPRQTTGIAFDTATGSHWIDTIHAPTVKGDYDVLFDIGEPPPWPSERVIVTSSLPTPPDPQSNVRQLLLEIRQAVSDAITIGVPDLQCQPYILGNPTPPTAHVATAAPTFDLSMGRGTDEWAITLRVMVSENADIGSQRLLDQFVEPSGPRSIKQAVEWKDAQNRPSLGGLVDNIRVISASGLMRFQTDGGAPMFGTEFTLQVYASGG